MISGKREFDSVVERTLVVLFACNAKLTHVILIDVRLRI